MFVILFYSDTGRSCLGYSVEHKSLNPDTSSESQQEALKSFITGSCYRQSSNKGTGKQTRKQLDHVSDNGRIEKPAVNQSRCV